MLFEVKLREVWNIDFRSILCESYTVRLWNYVKLSVNQTFVLYLFQIGFTSDWLKKGRENFEPVAE